jgi:hypothetical protein
MVACVESNTVSRCALAIGRPFDFAALRSGRTEKQHSPVRAERSRVSGGVEARGRP